MAVITKTVKPSGGDYTSLTAWDAGEATNLVTAGNSHVLECYKGDYGAGGGVNYTKELVDVASPWVCGASNTLTLTVPQAERHTGKPLSSGVYTGFAIRSTNTSFAIVLAINVTYVTVDGFIIDCDSKQVSGISANYSNFVVKNCISIKSSTGYGIKYQSPGMGYNNLAIDCYRGYQFPEYTAGFYCYNCGAQGSSAPANNIGFLLQSGVGSGTTVKNCWAQGHAVGWNISNANAVVQYCASDLEDLPSQTGNRENQTFTFVDAANDYFQPAANDAAIKGYGVDLSGTFTTDILGNTRATWDVGPFIAAGWGFKINGVTNASISKVNGVAKASISKVNNQG